MILNGGTLPVSSAAGAQSSSQLSNARCSGILFFASAVTAISKCIIDVALRTDEGNKNIMPKLALYPLAERADIQGGVGFGPTFATQNWTAAASETEDIVGLGFLVALGNIRVQGKDQLSATISVGSTAFSASESVQWAFFDGGPAPEHLLSFNVQTSGQTVAQDPEEVYVFRTSGDAADQQMAAADEATLTINERIGVDSYSFSGRMAWALTRAVGEVESEGTRRTAQVYGDRSVRRPGETVTVQLSGSDAANYAVLIVERIKSPERSQKAAADLRAELQGAGARLATKSPELMTAYRIEAALR